MNRTVLILGIVYWLGLGAWVLNHNVAVTGSTTLHWSNPTRPTAHFTWATTPTAKQGQAVVPARETRGFSITLPRGFTSGTLRVRADADLEILPEFRQATTAPATTREGDQLVASFSWSAMVARGRTFTIRLQNSDQTAAARIQSITLTATR